MPVNEPQIGTLCLKVCISGMIGTVNGYRSCSTYSRRALVDVEDTVVGARTDPGRSENQEGLFPFGVHKARVTGHSNEKPHRSRCGPCQVRLFSKGPLCSRGQYLRVLVDVPWMGQWSV